jgi:Helix-turn-helix domain
VDNDTESVDNLGNTVDTPDQANMSEASANVPHMTTGLVETHLMKSGEVCDLLHIGRTTLWEWRRDKRIEGIQHTTGGPWYYPADQPVIVAALRAVGSIR